MQIVRYNGKWYEIHPKKYEPEQQTYKVAWSLIKGTDVNSAYRLMFKEHREHAKLLYTLRKDE